MGKAAFADGQLLNLSPSVDGDVILPEVDVGWGEVAEALVVAPVVVPIDEDVDLRFQVAGMIRACRICSMHWGAGVGKSNLGKAVRSKRY